MRDRRVPWWGVASALSAPVLLIGGWTVAAQLQPGGFDQISGTISALAARDADHRWVMTTALLGLGLAHLATAAALRPASTGGRVLLGIGGLATLGVAAFPLPAGDGGSTAHASSAVLAFLALAAWPAFAPSAVGRGCWRRDVGLAASGVLLAAVLGFFAEVLLGDSAVGLVERVAAGLQATWPAVAALTSAASTPVSPARAR